MVGENRDGGRSGGGRAGARLWPPLVILILGGTFLGYRASSSDWRGISTFFETTRRGGVVRVQELPKGELGKLARNSRAGEVKVAEEKAEGPVRLKESDPLEEIRRESEKTKERIAGLEKLKEGETRRLDETAKERERKDRVAQGGLDGRELDRMLAIQRGMLREQMAWMGRMQRENSGRMGALDRDFFGGGMAMPFAMPMPMPPGVPRFEGMEPGADGIFRMPRGGVGVGRLRRFDVAGGRGFVWEFRQRRPERNEEGEGEGEEERNAAEEAKEANRRFD